MFMELALNHPAAWRTADFSAGLPTFVLRAEHRRALDSGLKAFTARESRTPAEVSCQTFPLSTIDATILSLRAIAWVPSSQSDTV